MRLSLTKAAHVVLSSAARQEIRVRSGRDDNSVAGGDPVFPVKVRGTADLSASLGMTKERATFLWRVVSAEASSNHSLYNSCPFLCHPERSRGICSSADLARKCFSTLRRFFRYRINIPEHSPVGFLADFRCAGSVVWRGHDLEVAVVISATHQLHYLALGAFLHDLRRDVADRYPDAGVVGLVRLGTMGNADMMQRQF